MQVAGIVAEYNPFHLGHGWHIAETRRLLGGDAGIVCVMSGNFVQRGQAAVMDKWRRAECALRGGADLVLELPTVWAAASAEAFAQGAVALLAATGVADMLSFGCESGDAASLSAAADCLRGMKKGERNTLLALLDGDTRREILLLNSFDEDEIGSRMTTNYISVPAGISVRQAMRSLIAQAAEHDNISTIYVVDGDRTLLGAIDLKKLILAREGTELAAITMTSYPYVYAEEPLEECVARLKDYSEDSIPVLDSDNRLLGVLTSQEIMELSDEAMEEDYAMFAGLSAEEDLREPLTQSIRKRLPWLVVLLGLGLVVSGVVGAFEGVVAQLPLIIAFQSLVLDMAGNVGTQSLAVTIRVLMDEHVDRKQKAALIGKETRIGLLNGLLLGVLSFLFVGLYLWGLKGQAPAAAFSISFCTGTALLGAMTLSSMSGTVIPLAFKKIRIDPAVASGPLITTVNDLVAVVIYYGLAWLLLIQAAG